MNINPVESQAAATAAVLIAVGAKAPPLGELEVLPRVPASVEGPHQIFAVASAVLRNSRPPEVAALIGPLQSELAALPTTTVPLSEIARSVLAVLRSFLPEGRPPNAVELRALVENGGLLHEAKLTRGGEPAADFKGRLIELLQTADRRGLSETVPTARTTFRNIVAQQAVNVLAQFQGAPYVLQIPVPNGADWTTVHLALEKDRSARTGPDTSGGFRLLLQVDLDEVGETWVEAGFAADRFRAVLYVDGDAVQERFQAALPSLRSELADAGFREVLLDIRPTADLTTGQRHRGAAMVAGLPESGHVLDTRA